MRFALALLPWLALAARDAPATTARAPHARVEEGHVEARLDAPSAPARVASWAKRLVPIEMTNVTTRARADVRLYADDGSIDDDARGTFERVAAPGPDETDAHPLALRLEQLVVKAAYHFQRTRVLVVSGFRPNAGRHGTGEALDFKLDGVSASRLAAYLRGLPRVGVGVYTHPRTQFVHLDVRDPSYHWIDASPPGVKWHEGMLRDPSAEKRDASWTAEMDLPPYEAPVFLSMRYLRK